MRNLMGDRAEELKKVIGSLGEKLDTGKYRAFSLELEFVIREYSDEFGEVGINDLSILSDLYYMEGHDEEIKNILAVIDNVLNTYIVYQSSRDVLSEAVSNVVHMDGYISKGDLSRSMVSIDDPDDELY